MNDYAWFRLLVRGIGLLLLGLSTPLLLWHLSWFVIWLAELAGGTSQTPLGQYARLLPDLLMYAAQAAFGIYLLRGGNAIVSFCLRGVAGRCAACGYDLTGIHSDRCPECGLPAPPLPRPRTDSAPPTPPSAPQ